MTEPTELSAAQQHGRYLLALADAVESGDITDLDKLAPVGALPEALQRMAEQSAAQDVAAGTPGRTTTARRWTTDADSVTRRRLAAAYWAEVDRLTATG